MRHHDAVLDVAETTPALAELFREHQLPLHQFLMGLLRNRAEADDVLQQVFLKLVEGWDTIRQDTAKSWLFTVAYREALARRRVRFRHEAALAELWSRPTWLSERAAPTGEVEAIRKETMQSVRSSLAALSEAQREVVERRIYRNQTFATIAAELNCPLGTVLTRMRLAIKTLARLLEE